MSACKCPSCGELAAYTSMHGPFPLGRCDNAGCATVWFTLATARVLVTADDVGAGGPTHHSLGDQVAKGRPWEPEVERRIALVLVGLADELDVGRHYWGKIQEAVSDLEAGHLEASPVLDAIRNIHAILATLTATAGDPSPEGLGNPPATIADAKTILEASWCPECGCPGSEYKGHRRCPRCGCGRVRVDLVGVPV